MRRAACLIVSALGVLLAASCAEQQVVDLRDCDDTSTRCQKVCNFFCDRWGCYPLCFDHCWTECYRYPDPPEVAAPADAATAPPLEVPARDAAVADATDAMDAAAGGDAGSTLCRDCAANDECGPGGLCIVRGGSEAGASGFCGLACTASECPTGFACTTLGDSRQCLPTSGACR